MRSFASLVQFIPRYLILYIRTENRFPRIFPFPVMQKENIFIYRFSFILWIYWIVLTAFAFVEFYMYTTSCKCQNECDSFLSNFMFYMHYFCLISWLEFSILCWVKHWEGSLFLLFTILFQISAFNWNEHLICELVINNYFYIGTCASITLYWLYL